VVKSGKKWEEFLPNFYGKYYYTLDSKGRTPIPPAFKEILSSNYSMRLVFVNDEFDKCLCAYPVDEWNALVEKIKKMPQTSDAVKFYRRRVIGSAVECELDKQGRVLIPSALRIDARLNNEIVLVGQGHKIEIWDKNEYEGVADPSKLDPQTIQAFKEMLSSHGL
jgi:MraZ protein